METLILVLLMLFGMLGHFLKKVIEARVTGGRVSLVAYWSENPYHAAFSVIVSLAAFLLLYGTPEMTRATAWFIGFSGDSIAGAIGRRRGEAALG